MGIIEPLGILKASTTKLRSASARPSAITICSKRIDTKGLFREGVRDRFRSGVNLVAIGGRKSLPVTIRKALRLLDEAHRRFDFVPQFVWQIGTRRGEYDRSERQAIAHAPQERFDEREDDDGERDRLVAHERERSRLRVERIGGPSMTENGNESHGGDEGNEEKPNAGEGGAGEARGSCHDGFRWKRP